MGGAAAAGVAGSAGSFTGSGGALGLLGVPKVQRVMSESVKPEAIAKGFAGEQKHSLYCHGAAAAAARC